MNTMESMNPLKKLSTLLVLLLALAGTTFMVACEGAEEPDEAEEVATADGTDAMGDDMGMEDEGVGTMDAMMAVDDVTVGTELSEDGSIETFNTDDEFAPGSTVYVAMEVGDATAGSEVRVVWYGPNGNEISSDTKTVLTGQHYMNFASPDTSDWELGTYRGEVWYGTEMINEFEFQIAGMDEAEPMQS